MLCGTACFFVRLFVVLARFCFRFGVQPVDAALRGRKVRSEVAVWQMGTKGGHKEVFAHDEDEGDGTHTEQVFQRRVMAHHQMAGNA